MRRKIRRTTKIEETGKRYGRLLVLRDSWQRLYGSIVWYCRCNCGKSTLARGTDLRSGRVLSCGCYHRELMRERGYTPKILKMLKTLAKKNLINLRGKKFGRWRVLDKPPRKIDGRIYWRCECECGTRGTISGYSLRAGQSKSCGCQKNRDRKGNKRVYRSDGTYYYIKPKTSKAGGGKQKTRA
jgi:hypothetical protein